MLKYGTRNQSLIDSTFSQVSWKTGLAFKDMGILKVAMDKRADSLLKKSLGFDLSQFKTSYDFNCGGQEPRALA